MLLIVIFFSSKFTVPHTNKLIDWLTEPVLFQMLTAVMVLEHQVSQREASILYLYLQNYTRKYYEILQCLLTSHLKLMTNYCTHCYIKHFYYMTCHIYNLQL